MLCLQGLRKDLADFTGLSDWNPAKGAGEPHVAPTDLDKALQSGPTQMRDAWNAGSKDVEKFYREEVGNRYLYDLGAWHLSDLRIVPWIAFAVHYALPPVMDWGGGIGSYTIQLAETWKHLPEHHLWKGEKLKLVNYYDLNPVHEEFVNFRLKRLGLQGMVKTYTNLKAFDGQKFGSVVCVDTLEHYADPAAGLLEIVSRLRPGGRLIGNWTFHDSGGWHPMHYTDPAGIAKFNEVLEQRFIQHASSPGGGMCCYSLREKT
jgi:SAM-dependent methyltransferase